MSKSKDRDILFEGVSETSRAMGDETTPQIAAHSPATRHSRFHLAVERARHSKYYKAKLSTEAPYGLFNGRPIIGERTRINGGIYIGVLPQEAVVVDDKYGGLSPIFEKLISVLPDNENDPRRSEKEVLRDVFELVTSRLAYDPLETSKVNFANNVSPDEKVTLDLYLESGVGMKRHRVLLAAYLIERLNSEKLLAGISWIDPRTTTPDGDDERLLYTLTTGEIVTFLG